MSNNEHIELMKGLKDDCYDRHGELLFPHIVDTIDKVLDNLEKLVK